MKLCYLFLLWLLATPLLAKTTSIKVEGGEIKLNADTKKLSVSDDELKECVLRAAKAVSSFYGRFPVKHLDITVYQHERDTGVFGQEFVGKRIKYFVGKSVPFSILQDDWVLTHEMFHTGFPDLADDYNWAGEGLATYLEPIARSRTGNLPEQSVWFQLFQGLPKGLPHDGDKGLNITHTWGRTYWGGALFWFLADLGIRQKTNNAKSLDTALRAILEKGGDGSQHWEMDKVIAVGDEAIGQPVLKPLYDRMAKAPGTEDLVTLFNKKLGITLVGNHVVFDDKAPLADIRKSITSAKIIK